MTSKFKLAVAGIAFLIVTPGACTLYNIYTAPSRVINRTVSTDNIITNYEWFKTQYNDILAIDKKIKTNRDQIDQFKNDAGPRDKWTFEDKNELARLNSISAGLAGHRAEMVATYNARSKMVNRSIFKSADLPETVE